MNIYHTPQYQNFRQEQAFLFSEDYLCQRPGKEPELPQGWTVHTSRYQGGVCRAARHQLLDSGGQVVYTWDNINDDGDFSSLFLHSNGKHYLVFREDLYGYSVLEVETGETMHYIPEKSWPLDGRQGEETFIWTGARYDPRTDLLAVSGCFWACPNGTLLLDFSDPLEEQDWEVWLDVQDVVDPDYDIYDDIDLEHFGEDGLLYFKTTSAEDGSPGAFTLPVDRTLELVRKKRSTDKE